MAQADSPYRDPRDARIEELEAENAELRERLMSTKPEQIVAVGSSDISPDIIGAAVKKSNELAQRVQLLYKERYRTFKKILRGINKYKRSLYIVFNTECSPYLYNDSCGCGRLSLDWKKGGFKWNEKVIGIFNWRGIAKKLARSRIDPAHFQEEVYKNIATIFAKKAREIENV